MSYGTRSAPAYLNSPAKLIHDGAGAIRRRLEGPSPLLDFPVLHDLVEMDCTDYVIMPILHSTGEINFISWATCKSGGFSTAQLTLLYDLLPLISLRVEVETAHEETRTLLNTYLGREPARRVLGGSVRRAQVESLSAAIWISDIRGFTQLSDRMPARVVIALLDDYFDIQAAAVESAGGEILKFMGDGLLAIFADGPSLVEDSRRALTAARRALRRLASENDERTGEGQPEIRCGIGLHAGEVRYGNIGARTAGLHGDRPRRQRGGPGRGPLQGAGPAAARVRRLRRGARGRRPRLPRFPRPARRQGAEGDLRPPRPEPSGGPSDRLSNNTARTPKWSESRRGPSVASSAPTAGTRSRASWAT